MGTLCCRAAYFELFRAVLLRLCLGTGSLEHGDTAWLISGLVFQEIDKVGRIKPATNC